MWADLFEGNVPHMLADEDAGEVGRLVPTGFARHLAVDVLAVDA